MAWIFGDFLTKLVTDNSHSSHINIAEAKHDIPVPRALPAPPDLCLEVCGVPVAVLLPVEEAGNRWKSL